MRILRHRYGRAQGRAYRVRAPFIIRGRWSWRVWTDTMSHGNKHAAIIAKGHELGAQGWDFGQADYLPADRANF